MRAEVTPPIFTNSQAVKPASLCSQARRSPQIGVRVELVAVRITLLMVPLLKPPGLQSCNLAPRSRSIGANPLDWSSAQRGQAFHCRGGTSLHRYTLRAPCGDELARFRLVSVYVGSQPAPPHVARLLTVPLLKPPGLQSCNPRAENPVHWRQPTRLEQCDSADRLSTAVVERRELLLHTACPMRR